MNQPLHLAVITVTTVLLLSPWLPDDVQAFPNYREQIPNGNRVMSPCIPFYLVPGVGHENPLGSGPRNAFGQDFATAGYMWTTDLCQADSDGDGMSNGQELGDPSCTWTPGATPARSRAITHPGINNLSPACIRRLIKFLRRGRRPRTSPASN